MSIRKDFLLDERVVGYIEKIAKIENKSQNDVIEEMITKKYEEYLIKEKLEAIDKIAGSMNGLIGDNMSIQSIKMSVGI